MAKVSHSLHTDLLPGLDTSRMADAWAGCFGFSFRLRRRRTSDNYTRVEGTITASVVRTDGAHIFTVYLTDDERRNMAAALLEGLD